MNGFTLAWRLLIDLMLYVDNAFSKIGGAGNAYLIHLLSLRFNALSRTRGCRGSRIHSGLQDNIAALC